MKIDDVIILSDNYSPCRLYYKEISKLEFCNTTGDNMFFVTYKNVSQRLNIDSNPFYRTIQFYIVYVCMHWVCSVPTVLPYNFCAKQSFDIPRLQSVFQTVAAIYIQYT